MSRSRTEISVHTTFVFVGPTRHSESVLLKSLRLITSLRGGGDKVEDGDDDDRERRDRVSAGQVAEENVRRRCAA